MGVVVLRGRLICANAEEASMVRRHLDRHVNLTRAEPGCLYFSVEPADEHYVWQVSERFEDQQSLDAHQERVRSSEWGRVTAHIKRDYVIEVVGLDSQA
ncbi:MAG: antibiotic biosynthesis monooxygenase [Kocuria sp.]|nr:antibiotic biosynthesis monooxygenase [Kocuria sp.]MDO5617245.1 antibiotic biosynthesis monooxygenase [Kocuria sp.]